MTLEKEGQKTGTKNREGARDSHLREGARNWHQRERGGKRLAPEREKGARNWHQRKRGPETCPRERGGKKLAPERKGAIELP